MNRCSYCPAPATGTIMWRRKRWLLGWRFTRLRTFRVCPEHAGRPFSDLKKGAL